MGTLPKQIAMALAPPLPSLHAVLRAAGRDPTRGRLALRRRPVPTAAGRVYCLFSGGSRNKKQEEAKKALESALWQKSTVFEKWNLEIEQRRQRENRRQGKAAAGGGGWSGGGGWFWWFSSGGFWDAARQCVLTILAILAVFFLIANGNVLVAIVVNSLLSVLRQIRNALSFLALCFSQRASMPVSGQSSSPLEGSNGALPPTTSAKGRAPMSAKERVVRKWGMD